MSVVERTSSPGERLARALRLALLALAAVATAHGLARAAANRVALHAVQGGWSRVLLAALVLAFGLAATALVVELEQRHLPERRTRRFAPARLLFAVLVASWVTFVALAQPFQRLWFDLALALALGLWAGVVLLERRAAERWPRSTRALELGAFGLAAALVLCEVGLRATAYWHASPLLMRAGDAPRALIERFRCEPGEARFGFQCNQRGYYDDEFRRKGEGERLVAAIGDSFNLGAVPHYVHFTSVCERELGCEVANLGVPGIGPREYRCMLIDDVLPLDPDVVVVGVFVGNDFSHENIEPELPDPWLRSFLSRDRCLAWVLARRLARIAEERGRRPGTDVPVAGVQGESAEIVGASSHAASFPWLADPSLETPTLSEAAFLRLETQRALEICRGELPALESFRASILAMRDACGSKPFVVMLIPDELQVEDGLWESVRAASGVALERDRPQQVVTGWLARVGVPCLDLLPVLRGVEPMQDGLRHLYHLRDTHFNVRGNRVVGAALAEFLRERLPR